MTTRLGYACLNMTLQSKKPKITCNRGMIKRTFLSKGVEYASSLALQNTSDLIEIIKWNNKNGIKVFRITSCLFPWGSEYNIDDLPDIEKISHNLSLAGKIARDSNQRLSFHPGPFNILSSPKDHVVKNSYTDLEMHGKIFDMMGMPRNHWSKINIHVGASYGDREKSLSRFCKNFEGLSDSVRSRLTVENDDKGSLYSTKMLYDGVYRKIGVPIVFDSHHFECGPKDVDYEESLLLAIDSWPKEVRPQCHHSNSRKIHEDPKVAANAHSDWYYKPFNDCGFSLDVVLESKKKELALIKYREDFLNSESLAA